MTIHITPEADYSYVSLEMNVPLANYPNFISKVINLFKPGKFMLNLITPDLRQVAAKAKARLLNGVFGATTPIETEPTNLMPNCFDDDGDESVMNNELANIHGLMLYEELLVTRFSEFRRCDLQLAHYKHSDIVYARYVADGIS